MPEQNINQQEKILLIEDEKILLEMYSFKFSKDGFKVIQAKDGEDGLRLASKEKPNLILLDIIMPKMDGFTVLKKLKEGEATKEIPVILLTNLGQNEDMKKGLNLGALDYLVKANHTPTQVVEKIKKVLEGLNVLVLVE